MLKFALLFSLLNLSLFAQEKILDQDQLVLKMQNDVYFLSDLNKVLINLKPFVCFFPSSLIFEIIDGKKIPEKFEKDSLTAEKMFITTSLLKLEKFVSSREVILEKKTLDFLYSKKCLSGNWNSWGTEIKELISTEIYFRGRFRVDFLDENLISDKNVISSFESFLSGLHKKMPHEFFF